jgi:hypothetical protein
MQIMANGNAISIANGPKYPRVKVHVTGPCGGFYSTVAAFQAAMRRAGVPLRELSDFYADAAEGEEDNLLRTCLRWVDVDLR